MNSRFEETIKIIRENVHMAKGFRDYYKSMLKSPRAKNKRNYKEYEKMIEHYELKFEKLDAELSDLIKLTRGDEEDA